MRLAFNALAAVGMLALAARPGAAMYIDDGPGEAGSAPPQPVPAGPRVRLGGPDRRGGSAAPTPILHLWHLQLRQ